MKNFYRVHHPDGLGLWYDQDGRFTNEISKIGADCAVLDMSFDEDCLGGFLSCTDTFESLFNWFSLEEMKMMKQCGYDITIFQSDDYRQAVKCGHYLFNIETAKVIGVVSLNFETPKLILD